MSRQIIKQPDGKFSIYSSISDSFILTDATQEEVIQFFVDETVRVEKENLKTIFDQIAAGKEPYHQFTLSYEEAKKNDEIHQQKLFLTEFIYNEFQNRNSDDVGEAQNRPSVDHDYK